jgi:hypothetical protein
VAPIETDHVVIQTQDPAMRKIAPLLPLAILTSAGAGVAAPGCGADPPEPTAATPAEGPAQDSARAADGASKDEPGDGEAEVPETTKKTERYSLTIATPEAKAGEPGEAKVKVVPKGKWHLNLAFPTSLKMDDVPGVELTKPHQKRADAVKLQEDYFEYGVGFVADAPGEKSMTGKFRFAICIDEACVPVTEKLAFAVAVK